VANAHKRVRVSDGVQAEDHVSLVQYKSSVLERASRSRGSVRDLEKGMDGFLTGSL
jgi:hypothetical protein